MVDKKSNIPYYIQIKEDLLEKINSGFYKTGKKIPTEIELSNIYEVSRITIREAIKELINENRIEVFKGRGMYVKPYTLQIHYMDGHMQVQIMMILTLMVKVLYQLIMEIHGEYIITLMISLL